MVGAAATAAAVLGGEMSSTGAPGPGGGQRPELEEPCPVCGDKVSGYHYGLLTCESCKVRPAGPHGRTTKDVETPPVEGLLTFTPLTLSPVH